MLLSAKTSYVNFVQKRRLDSTFFISEKCGIQLPLFCPNLTHITGFPLKDDRGHTY